MAKDDGAHAKTFEKNRMMSTGSESEDECPLFMTTLPSKQEFDNNSGIQALCTLVQGDDIQEEEQETMTMSKEQETSTSKVRKSNERIYRRCKEKREARRAKKPYEKRNRSRASFGECQVYMSLLSSIE